MKVTYSLALAILAIAVTSAGRIPVKHNNGISNNDGDVSDAQYDSRFHNQRSHGIENQHPQGGNQHDELREHAKRPNILTTESPSTVDVEDVTTTESELEDASVNPITVTFTTAESELETKSEANISVDSVTEPQTESVLVITENAASSENSKTEPPSAASEGMVAEVEAQTEAVAADAGNEDSIANSEPEATSVTSVNDVSSKELETLVESAEITVDVTESDSENASTAATAIAVP